MKKVPIKERFGLEWRLEAFNLFNRVVFGGVGAATNTVQTFRHITSQRNTPRQCQAVMKVTW